jgi:hypothetical protein
VAAARALDAGEIATLEAEREHPGRAAVDRATEAALLEILTDEPRITVAALADRLSTSKPRAAAALATVLATERIVLRTDIARPYSEWPVYAWYFLTSAPANARPPWPNWRRCARLGSSRP